MRIPLILLLSLLMSFQKMSGQASVSETVSGGNVVGEVVLTESLLSPSSRTSAMLKEIPGLESHWTVLYFSSLRIPGRDTLFVLDEEGKVLRHYAAGETLEGGATAAGPFEAARIRLFYKTDPLTRDLPEIILEGVGRIPVDAWKTEMQTGGGAESTLPCKINVNCSPEGDAWQDVKNGVVKILLKKGSSLLLASGALMNNTALDNTPYLLTSDDCANGATAADLNQWIFFFGYELAGCDTSWTSPPEHSLTGATFIARGGISCNLYSDFYLVRLKQMIPQSFQPYLLGYDRSGLAPDSVVSIHHRGGFFKQIATSYSGAVSSTFFGGLVESHWKVHWSATASGHAVTANGSQGAPLLDEAGRVIGVWSYGSSSCAQPTQPDYFGKLSLSWQQYLSTPATRLKEWLDPLNTGQITLDGMYPTAYPPEAGFTQSATGISEGDSVFFWDVSYGNPDQWQWEFPGGQPSSWSGSQPPAIYYAQPGAYDVRLYVDNVFGQDSLIQSGLIQVYPDSSRIHTWIENQPLCADTVEIAILVENLYYVRNASLTLNIDTVSVRFLGYSRLHPALDAANVQVYLSGQNIWLQWNTPTMDVHIGSDTLAVLRLLLDTGTHAFHWNTSRPWMNRYYDANGQAFPVSFGDADIEGVACGSLGGQLRYVNGAPVPAARIMLQPDSAAAPLQAMVNDSGYYFFPRVLPGAYTLEPRVLSPWGGANATDALRIMRHFVRMDTLDQAYLKAADVNASGAVNATDALLVAQRFSQLISAFPGSDWISDNIPIQMGTAHLEEDLEVICRGDVDGSYVPVKSQQP